MPAASGSAYLELEVTSLIKSVIPTTSTIKVSCAVQGPKPLPRNSSFSPNLQLTASVKFAPFATRQRRGYLRDGVERDLGSHLENALNGVIILDRWPKSALDIAVMVLEGEEDCLWNEEQGQERGINGVGLMNVLAASINVSMAALVDAKIDCLDLLSSGVAARAAGSPVELLDPCPSEHEELTSACVVGYLPARDELVEVWSKNISTQGNEESITKQLDAAIKAAKGSHKILTEVITETLQKSANSSKGKARDATHDMQVQS